MITETLLSCGLAACFALGMQSLADLARQEAERRKALEQEGVQAKVIEGTPAGLAPDVETRSSNKSISSAQKEPRNASAKPYRSALQKLDRSITRTEERLQLLRSRLQEARWALPKVGRRSRRSGSSDAQSRIRAEIDKLENQLKQARKERAAVFDEGRKAGFLPGELDGKGIVP